jgi:hypothetical protein
VTSAGVDRRSRTSGVRQRDSVLPEDTVEFERSDPGGSRISPAWQRLNLPVAVGRGTTRVEYRAVDRGHELADRLRPHRSRRRTCVLIDVSLIGSQRRSAPRGIPVATRRRISVSRSVSRYDPRIDWMMRSMRTPSVALVRFANAATPRSIPRPPAPGVERLELLRAAEDLLALFAAFGENHRRNRTSLWRAFSSIVSGSPCVPSTEQDASVPALGEACAFLDRVEARVPVFCEDLLDRGSSLWSPPTNGNRCSTRARHTSRGR